MENGRSSKLETKWLKLNQAPAFSKFNLLFIKLTEDPLSITI